MKKITVLGDIMTEPVLLEQVKTEAGYDYSRVFAPLSGMLSKADYVIANLETPLAGETAGYTDRLVSFNAPDALAEALKAIGVDAVITANNHALDRGIEGLTRTLQVLDFHCIAHTGTYASPEDPRIVYFDMEDTKVALIAATASVNSGITGLTCPDWQVNMLNPMRPSNKLPQDPRFVRTKACVEKLCGRKLAWEEGIELKAAMGVSIAHDGLPLVKDDTDPYLKVLARDVDVAKRNADVVIFCPHIGGQFNVEPGESARYVVEWASRIGFDAVLASHSHTTQPAKLINGVPCFYCLGNVTMSANTVYSVSESLPSYGIAVHLYVDGGLLIKTAFSIYKILEKPGESMQVVPIDQLEAMLSDGERQDFYRDVQTVYCRVTGKKVRSVKIRPEYDIF